MGGNIQKLGGRWRSDYRDPQGRRHRASFDTRQEADNTLTDIKSRIGRGDFVASKLIPKFREVAEDWFRSKADRRPGTVGNWRAQIDLPLNPKLGDLRLDRIDVALIEKVREVYSHWFKNVETDSVDRLAKSLTTGSKNLGHFLDTLGLVREAGSA